MLSCFISTSSYCDFNWSDHTIDPDAFHITLMKLLPKKGDHLSDPDKRRGNSKNVSSIIAHRLGKHFLEVGLDGQCGGVFQKGCADTMSKGGAT